jgi:hypothetical protein
MDLTINCCALLSIHTQKRSFHLGVYPEHRDVCKETAHGYVDVECKRWLWGRYIEPYDKSLVYLCFGPFLEVVWSNW